MIEDYDIWAREAIKRLENNMAKQQIKSIGDYSSIGYNLPSSIKEQLELPPSKPKEDGHSRLTLSYTGASFYDEPPMPALKRKSNTTVMQDILDDGTGGVPIHKDKLYGWQYHPTSFPEDCLVVETVTEGEDVNYLRYAMRNKGSWLIKYESEGLTTYQINENIKVLGWHYLSRDA